MPSPNATVATVSGFPVFDSTDSSGRAATPSGTQVWNASLNSGSGGWQDWPLDSSGVPKLTDTASTTYQSQLMGVSLTQPVALRLVLAMASNLTTSNSNTSFSQTVQIGALSSLLIPNFSSVTYYVFNTTNETLTGLALTFSETQLGLTAATATLTLTPSTVSVAATNGTGIFASGVESAVYGATLNLSVSFAAAPTSGSSTVVLVLS